MNAFLFHVASGHAFFSGTGLIVAAVLQRIASPRRLPMLAGSLAAILGAFLVAISGTPLPLAFYAVAGIALALWLAIDRPPSRRPRLVVWLRSAVIGASLLGVAPSSPGTSSSVPFPDGTKLFIIGDSVSAGMNDGEKTWPKRLRSEAGIDVRDFSHVGATAETAMKQAERVEGPGVVIVEIGGNDILGPGAGTPPDEFGFQLDALLERLSADGRTVAMLELPLPALKNEFGAIQRRLARKHEAILIPKRLFIGVLTAEGATLDGVHLSPAGHQMMADRIVRLLAGGDGR